MSRTDYTQRLVTRAERDDAFRRQLVSDPRAAIKHELGIDVPESIRLRVIEEQPDEAILVLPAHPSTGPLSDEQLEGIAGAGNYDAGTSTNAAFGFSLGPLDASTGLG